MWRRRGGGGRGREEEGRIVKGRGAGEGGRGVGGRAHYRFSVCFIPHSFACFIGFVQSDENILSMRVQTEKQLVL